VNPDEEPPPGPPSEWDIDRWHVYAVQGGGPGTHRRCVGWVKAEDPPSVVEADEEGIIREGPEPLHGLELWNVHGPRHVAAEEERAREKAEEKAAELREAGDDAEVLLQDGAGGWSG
jgi:hypothetical protein